MSSEHPGLDDIQRLALEAQVAAGRQSLEYDENARRALWRYQNEPLYRARVQAVSRVLMRRIPELASTGKAVRLAVESVLAVDFVDESLRDQVR